METALTASRPVSAPLPPLVRKPPQSQWHVPSLAVPSISPGLVKSEMRCQAAGEARKPAAHRFRDRCCLERKDAFQAFSPRTERGVSLCGTGGLQPEGLNSCRPKVEADGKPAAPSKNPHLKEPKQACPEAISTTLGLGKEPVGTGAAPAVAKPPGSLVAMRI